MSARELSKVVVSVTEMARMVGLSRARFYQLQKAGILPQPERDEETGRPFYTEEQQQVCLSVREQNLGANGKAVLFYTRRHAATPPVKPRKASAPKKQDQHANLTDSLHALGLASVTTAQVGTAVKELYPTGTSAVDEAEVVKKVFLFLKRKEGR